jgi:large subunit ribosomal protein L31e
MPLNAQESEVVLKKETVDEENIEETTEVAVEEEKAKKVTEEVVKEKEKVKEEKTTLKKKEEKEKEEEDIVEERIYTVPLSKAWISPRTRHSPRAIKILKSFVMKHMKIDGDSIKITNEVNEKIWKRGIQKPPRKIKVRVTKDSEGIVTVHLAGD